MKRFYCLLTKKQRIMVKHIKRMLLSAVFLVVGTAAFAQQQMDVIRA